MVSIIITAPAALCSRTVPAFPTLSGTHASWQITSTYGTGVFTGSSHASRLTVDVPAVPAPMVVRDRNAKQAAPPRGVLR